MHQAHAALEVKYGDGTRPGDGVTIGVMDSGVDRTHGEFSGASITETLLQGLPDETRAVYGPGQPGEGGFSHGTAVTSIMAAQPNQAGFLGIAYGADFKVFGVPIGAHIPHINGMCPDDSTNPRCTFNWTQAYRDVLRSGVDIVNNSYSASGTFIENYTTDTFPFGAESAVIAQTATDAADRAIFVWAAGNDHGVECTPTSRSPDNKNCKDGRWNATSPSVVSGAVALLPELRGHNVVVVATDQSGVIADFSNRCGIAGQWCIAAPGVGLRGALFANGAPPSSVASGFAGTSFAAPMVSGGLALMKHFFRDQLTNRELVTRLFATADKDGIYATSSIYGQGFMDLGAAVSPVSTPQVTTSGRVGDAGSSLRTTALRLGAAFGDGLARALAGREIAAFDALGAPFWFEASGFAGPATRPSSLARLHALMVPGQAAYRPVARGTRMTFDPYARAVSRGEWRFGLYESPANAESSLLNLAGNAATVSFKAQHGFEATAFTTVNQVTSFTPAGLPRQRTPDVGALLAWRPPETPVGVRVGWLKEGNSLLGSTADGAFGRLSANNVFTGFEAATEVGGWHLALDTEVGLVAPAAGGGLIDGFSWLTTSALSLRAHRRLGSQDEITVSVSQPPRIETGWATLTLPVGRTWDGMVLRESFSAGLVPSTRQVDVAARWRRTGVLGGEWRAEAAVSHNPGHVAAKPLFNLLAGWQTEF